MEMYVPLLAEIGVAPLTGEKGKIDTTTAFVSNAETLLAHLSRSCNAQQELNFVKYMDELGRRHWWASAGQTIKGLWSTGPWTSIQYVKTKVGKALGSK